MRMALFVIIIFLVYLSNELKVMPPFWVGVLGVGGILCLLRDYSESKKRHKK